MTSSAHPREPQAAQLRSGLARYFAATRPAFLTVTLVCCLIYFPILNQHSIGMTMAIMGAFLGFTQFQSGIQPVWFAESFPTEARYTGSALSYSGANLLTGGPMPIVAVALLETFHGSPWAIVAVCGSLNLLSFIMIAISRETRGTALETSHTH